MTARPNRSRFILMALAGVSLILGLWGGLMRLGWVLSTPGDQFASVHGPLMVVGFLGTLIGLERAAAMGMVWPYAIPLLSSASALSALGGLPMWVSASSAMVAAALLIVFFLTLYRRYHTEHFIIMALSAFAWFAGNFLWFNSSPFFSVAPWWACFLTLMIAGERLELSRVTRPRLAVRLIFHASVAGVLLGLAYSLYDFPLGLPVAGAGLLALAAWLLRFDMARRSAERAGLPRFMASCLIVGYIWLAVGGVFWIVFPDSFGAGLYYDAMLHAIFIGFVFSMIFAHAPVILPAITGLPMAFQNLFYLHAVLLHASLLMRVAGALGSWQSLQQWGGLINVLAIVIFLANNIRAVKIGTRAVVAVQ